MGKQKQYSSEMKTQVVLEVLKGQKSLAQICREYEVAADLVCHWCDVFSERAPQAFADPRSSGLASKEQERIADLERMVGRLTMELDASKSLEAAALASEQRREIVRRLATAYPVQVLCDILQLPRSTYYYRSHADEELELREATRAIAVQSPRSGSRRITAQLRREGWSVNRKHLQRLMREENLLVEVRRYCQTTNRQRPYGCYPNLVKGREVVRPNQVWCADITYIRLPRQFVETIPKRGQTTCLLERITC